MLDVPDETLAERLSSLLERSRFRMTPGLLGKLSGLPKATLVNWLEGRVTRPRRWQDVVRVADALRLAEDATSALLVAAGHPTVPVLAHSPHVPEDERLLAPWAHELSRSASERRRLPYPGELVAREDVAANLRSLLTSGKRRLVTVTGMPGVGKTHLAVDVARTIATHFDCEPVWIPLGSVTGSTRIVAAVATALGQAAQNETTLARLLARQFCDRSILFVVDNAEHLVDAASAIMSLLESAAGITVLLTSRAPLRCAGEAEVRIVPLAVPRDGELEDARALRHNPAVRMFAAHADGLDLQHAPDDVVLALGGVVRHLEGIPLALALAAAQLRLFTPSALAKNVASRFSILSNARLGVDGRRQTLRTAIDWSYALLRPADRWLFDRCALFENGWTLRSATAVTGIDDGSTAWRNLATLTTLVEHGLVLAEPDAQGEPRFRMLGTMREYALERLHAGQDRRETERSFVDYYSRLISDASRACATDAAAWPSDLFRIEAPNVMAALELAIARGDSSAALTMATAWSIWETQSEVERGLELTRKALALEADPRDGEIVASRARAFRTLGILAIERNETAEANVALRAALELMDASGDARGLAIARCDLAFLSYRLENDDDCRAYAERALAYFGGTTPEPHRELGWVYSYLALAEIERSHATSEELCELALGHATAAPDKRLCAYIFHLQGFLATRVRNVSLAEEKFVASIRQFGAQETSISFNSLAGLGIVAAAKGDLQRAIVSFVAAERGLQGVRDFGMTLRQLSPTVRSTREAIENAVSSEAVAAWSKGARTLGLQAAMRFRSEGDAAAAAAT